MTESVILNRVTSITLRNDTHLLSKGVTLQQWQVILCILLNYYSTTQFYNKLTLFLFFFLSQER